MVFSKITGEIEYNETKGIDPEDKGYESALYEVDFFEKDLVITLGKPKYTFAKYHVVYYPIYLVNSNNGIEGQLGVYEIDDKKVLKLNDTEGDIDITKLGYPLFYEFAERVVRQSTTSVSKYLLHWDKSNPEKDEEPEKPEEPEAVVSKKDDDSLDDVVDDIFVHRPSPQVADAAKELEHANKILERGVFDIDTNAVQPKQLMEETEQDANDIKSKYKETSKQPWIQKLMKNPYYRIHEVESNGDCLFAVVRDAFKQIGHNTTVEKLRAIVAAAATDGIYKEHKQLYSDFIANINHLQDEIDKIRKLLEKDMKKRAKGAKDNKMELEAVLKEVASLKKEYKRLKDEKTATEESVAGYLGNMKSINNLDEFRQYIMTSSYWADSWAISVLERELLIKMIIFSELSYNENANDSVLECGELSQEIQDAGQFAPNYYIMTCYNGSHYRLLSYKDKLIFTFREIPYHVKILITNKCMERNSGVFHLIQDFRNFNSRLGVDVEAADIDASSKDEEHNKYEDLYDSDIVFMFHSSSQKTPKPGKGSGEKIPVDKTGQYLGLGKIPDWRRKLDDSWDQAPFSVDGKRWLSVEHYYQGAKFKKGFPDFYAQFSIESDSDISKDVELAKSAGGKTGKKRGVDKLLRPKSIVVDPDFYGQKRNELERETAIRSKFNENIDLKELLKLTRPAKLLHFVRGSEPEVDTILMKIRNSLD